MSKTTSLSNKALVISGIDKIDYRPWPLELEVVDDKPLVPEGQVLVRVKASGICGSDIHFLKRGGAGPDVFEKPFIVGHESAGEIEEVGAKVTEWKKGDHVAIKPGAPCLKCHLCTTGLSNLCPFVDYFGTPACNGSACTVKLVPEAQLVRLTPKISWAEAGCIQPLAISIQMARQAELKAHQKVMIFGGGCIGLLLGAIAKAYGAAQVVVLEKQPHRATFAARYCADHVFVNPPRLSDSETTEQYSTRVANHILTHTPGMLELAQQHPGGGPGLGGFDVSIEASGQEECMQMGMKVARKGGIYVQVGLYTEPVDPRLPIMEICSKQLDVRGTWRYSTDCFEDAVDLVDRNLVDLKSIVSHVYRLEDGPEAFEALVRLEDRQGRKLLKPVLLHDERDVEEEMRSREKRAEDGPMEALER